MLTKIAGTNQNLTSSGSSAQSTAFTSVNKVRIAATQAVYIAFAANPTATSSDLVLPANGVETFTITPGHKVAVLQVTSGGIVSITPIK
jgi:hypothetical protein